MIPVPLAGENPVRVVLEVQKFPELRIGPLNLVRAGPAVIGQVVASALVEGAVDQRLELRLSPVDTCGGVFHQQVEDNAGEVTLGPPEESFVLRLTVP